MLTSAISSRSAGSLYVRANGIRALGQSSTVLIRSVDQQRGFRYGLWSSQLDPECQQEARRRRRVLKHKQLDAVGGNPAWDSHPDTVQPTKIVKRMASHYGPGSQDTKPAQDSNVVGPEESSKDIGRGELEQILFGDSQKASPSSGGLGDVKPSAPGLTSSTGPLGSPVASSASSLEPDYVIDPITNRKVPKISAKTSLEEPLPVESRKFTGLDPTLADSDASNLIHTCGPIFDSDMPATSEELRKYSQNFNTGTPASRSYPPVLESEEYVKNQADIKHTQDITSSRPHYKGVFWHWGGSKVLPEQDFATLIRLRAHTRVNAVLQESKNAQESTIDKSKFDGNVEPSTTEDPRLKYKDLNKYRPIIEPESPAPEDPTSRYEDLDQYKPVMEKRTPQPEDPSTQYEDLDKYTPVMEKRTPQPEDPSTQYEDLDKYQPVMEKQAPEPEDPSAQYKDLDKYEPVMEKATTSLEQPFPQYEDLNKYDAVKHNEPDGKPEGYVEREVYTDLGNYNAFRYNEPDGKPEGYVERETYTDLTKYIAFRHNEPDGKPEGYVEQEIYPDLDQYKAFMYNEPDGKPADFVEQEVYPDLDQYKAFMYNEPDGKPPGYDEPFYDEAELGQYGAFRYNEPDGKPAMVADAAEITEELDSYADAVRVNEPDGRPASMDAEDQPVADLDQYGPVKYLEPDGKPLGSGTAYEDLDSYGAVRYNEPDGKAPESDNAAATGLEEFDTAQKLSGLNMYAEPTAAERAEDIDLLRASDVRASTDARAQTQLSASENPEAKSKHRDMLESLLPEHHAAWDAADQEASQTVKDIRGTVMQPDSRGRTDATSKPPNLVSSLHGSFQSRLTGSRPLNTCDLSSLGPTCLGNTALQSGFSGYYKVYGKLSKDAQKAASADDSNHSFSSGNATEPSFIAKPTIYKVLAYDTTTRTVKIAETTSSVPDSSPLLPPGQAFLQLSNPTKFFPHLAQLQNQGFEIVSGSDDVLIFRKARDFDTEGYVMAGAPHKGPDMLGPPAVNPIDMTGALPRMSGPASANFASPTGYVRYDPDPLDDSRPPPPLFHSNTNVDRLNDTPSGSSSSPSPSQPARPSRDARKTPHLAKRMAVGAAWVAGVSYGLGVVGEYFKTGGADGKGPKRF